MTENKPFIHSALLFQFLLALLQHKIILEKNVRSLTLQQLHSDTPNQNWFMLLMMFV